MDVFRHQRHYEKVNTDELGKHIKTILAQNQYTGFIVKILNQYTPFLARVEGLENIAVVEQEDTKAREQEIRNLIMMPIKRKQCRLYGDAESHASPSVCTAKTYIILIIPQLFRVVTFHHSQY